jgi:ribosomal protein S25
VSRLTTRLQADVIRDLQRRSMPVETPSVLPVHPGRAYVPATAETIETDPNLTDGARRCARILAAYVHRRAREEREAPITVTWIAARMGVCRRTAQRYLRQLEHAGYIAVSVCATRARMCCGLIVQVLDRLLPGHGWQKTSMKPDVTNSSRKYRP